MKRTLYVKANAAASRSKESEGTLQATTRILNEAVFEVLLDLGHIQALHDS